MHAKYRTNREWSNDSHQSLGMLQVCHDTDHHLLWHQHVSKYKKSNPNPMNKQWYFMVGTFETCMFSPVCIHLPRPYGPHVSLHGSCSWWPIANSFSCRWDEASRQFAAGRCHFLIYFLVWIESKLWNIGSSGSHWSICIQRYMNSIWNLRT